LRGLVAVADHRGVWRRRADTYNPKDDLTGIIARLMRIDAKLDEILLRLDEDDDGEEDEI
jgi:hypothetical protein